MEGVQDSLWVEVRGRHGSIGLDLMTCGDHSLHKAEKDAVCR